MIIDSSLHLRTFDYIDKDNPFYNVEYRVVCSKIDGKEEQGSIITNLPFEQFTPDMIKELYNLRQGYVGTPYKEKKIHNSGNLGKDDLI